MISVYRTFFDYVFFFFVVVTRFAFLFSFFFPLCIVYSYLLRTRLSPSVLKNTRTIHAIMIHVV